MFFFFEDVEKVSLESIEGKRLNRGEWAEFYVMLDLLGKGRLYTANSLLQKNYNSYLDIIKIIREEIESHVIEYIVDKQAGKVIIRAQKSDRILAEYTMAEFSENAKTLFEGISNQRGNCLSVNAPEQVCKFAKIIYVSKPKAPAVKALKQQFGGKNDIFIEVRDSQTSIVSVMGFSIKSQFGSDSTLFNAGSSSQFLYELKGCDERKMNEFNSISDGEKRGWAECKNYLRENDIAMVFKKPKNPVYEQNLLMVREAMSKILAWCMKDRLIDGTGEYNVKETTERMISENPLHVSSPKVYYEKAVKDFLMAGFTGMTAGKVWDGREQVNGGYIVVMDDGQVLCYHSNDREAFRDYLYRNTRFEYVACKKYKWGYIEKADNTYYLPLNMSVRFNKKTR